MPRSELIAEAYEPTRFWDWLDDHRQRIVANGKVISKAKFYDALAAALDVSNLPRPKRSARVTLRRVIKYSQALAEVEDRFDVPPERQGCVIYGLLAAGAYIEYAVVIGNALESADWEERLTAGWLGVMFEVPAVFWVPLRVPDTSAFLKLETGDQYASHIQTLRKFERYLTKWMKRRLWDNAPTSTLPAVASFQRYQVELGLGLLGACTQNAQRVHLDELLAHRQPRASNDEPHDLQDLTILDSTLRMATSELAQPALRPQQQASQAEHAPQNNTARADDH